MVGLAGRIAKAMGADAGMVSKTLAISRSFGTIGLVGAIVGDLLNWRRLGEEPPAGTMRMLFFGGVPLPFPSTLRLSHPLRPPIDT
jgi:hypothetical protein